MAGIQNTQKVLDLVKVIGESLKAVLADDKIDWNDLPRLVPILAKVKPAIESAKLMGPELKSMTDADIEALTLQIGIILAIYISAFVKPEAPQQTVTPL